jgi:hypothetical protein
LRPWNPYTLLPGCSVHTVLTTRHLGALRTSMTSPASTDSSVPAPIASTEVDDGQRREPNIVNSAPGIECAVTKPFRYTEGAHMARKVLAWALACAFASAPIAAQLCDITCAEYAGISAPGRVRASHHHHSAGTEGQATPYQPGGAGATARVAVRASSTACRHVDAVVTESRDIVRIQLVAATLTTNTVGALGSPVSFLGDLESLGRLLVFNRPISPLRI